MTRRPPVFIVGSPRSGTTWLYHILLSAGGFAIYRTEPKVFTYLAPLYGNFRSHTQRQRFLDRWISTEDFYRSGLDAAYVRDRVLHNCKSAADFQRILMDGVAEQQGAERWSDCTPDNLLFIEEIHRNFPNALFIHMLRDGRDVALSMARQRWIRPLPWDRRGTLLAAALYWEWAIGKGRDAGRRLSSASYLEVHYRDLVQRYTDTLSRISTFIRHDLDPSRIERAGIGSVSRPNTSFAGQPGGGDFQPVDRWRSSCTDKELRLMEGAIGPRLAELGYTLLTTPNPRTGATANLAFYRLNFALRFWLKSRTRLGQWLSDTSLLEVGSDHDPEDKTLRPGLHPDFIRNCVSVEARPIH